MFFFFFLVFLVFWFWLHRHKKRLLFVVGYSKNVCQTKYNSLIALTFRILRTIYSVCIEFVFSRKFVKLTLPNITHTPCGTKEERSLQCG